MTEITRIAPATLFDVMYAAGLFEGEGCIQIKRSRPRGNLSYGLEVLVNMCDPEPPRRLHALWGGKVYQFKRDAYGPWRDNHRWNLHASNAAAFLEDIEPYLLSVRLKTKARLAITFQAQKTHGTLHHDYPAYRERQAEFYRAMRELNKRGSGALEDVERFATLAGMGVAP